jgi:ATP-dependent 26S proteasome regulatory subunit
MPTPAENELETLIRARYPIIYVVSWEEHRVEEALRRIAAERGRQLFAWTITQGFGGSVGARDAQTRDPLAALDYVLRSSDQAVYVLKDFHAFIGDYNVTRRLRDLTAHLKNSLKSLVILSPTLKLPSEIEKEVTVVDFALPSYEDLGKLLDEVVRVKRSDSGVDVDLLPEEREAVLKAAQGLTLMEAENVFAKSLVEKHTFDVDVILTEKEQIIRKSGILEYYPADESMASVGGLDLLKDWLQKRTVAFTDRARDFGLPEPKGILLIGVQGCGKSLSAKAIGAEWRLPMLRLDIGKVFAGLVGASEENMRKAIRVAESVAPCILWLDELEKGLSGTQSSGSTDGGTTSRVFSTFLTWLQEKTVPVFVVATANNVEALPPELLRKGRFDEIFFIDLPAHAERQEIFRIHLRKRKRDPAAFDAAALAEAAPGFSGAEIEQVVVEALYDAFDRGGDLVMDDLRKAIQATVPLAVTMREKIDDLRDWAATRARMTSSAPSESVEDLTAAFLANRIIAQAEAKAAASEPAHSPAPRKPRARKAQPAESAEPAGASVAAQGETAAL